MLHAKVVVGLVAGHVVDGLKFQEVGSVVYVEGMGLLLKKVRAHFVVVRAWLTSKIH